MMEGLVALLGSVRNGLDGIRHALMLSGLFLLLALGVFLPRPLMTQRQLRRGFGARASLHLEARDHRLELGALALDLVFRERRLHALELRAQRRARPVIDRAPHIRPRRFAQVDDRTRQKRIIINH